MTREPNNYLIDLASDLVSETLIIYIAIDNSGYNTSSIPTNLRIIKYDEETCKSEGYVCSLLKCTLRNVDRPCSWDKALYHFCVKDLIYDNVYFVEDDVFISDRNIFSNIDKKYESADLICSFNVSEQSDPRWCNWKEFNNLEKPWYHSMVCACRLSNKLLSKIVEYANANKRLLFHEFFFNTIANTNNLVIKTPPEFENIHWCADWNISNIQKGKLYHPLKSPILHDLYRRYLDNNEAVKSQRCLICSNCLKQD